MNKQNVMVQDKDNQPNVTQLNKEMFCQVCLHNNNKYKGEMFIVAKRIIISTYTFSLRLLIFAMEFFYFSSLTIIGSWGGGRSSSSVEK